MRIKSKLVWKLSVVVAVILIAATALSGYVNNYICAHYSQESAQAFLEFNSESIVQGIGQLMMGRNNEGIQGFIAEISKDSEVYGDIRLMDHHSGEVAAARFGRDHADIGLQDRACSVCHDLDDPGLAETEMMDVVIDRPDGERVLSVVAPILNEPRCSSASCHAHADDPPILGILSTDYSLRRLDAMAGTRRVFIICTVFTSLALGMVALWLMFTPLLEKPISELIAGTRRIAANELDFRFAQTRDDEIGALEESFNTMTARIQAHRDELRSAMEYLGGIVENSADILITVDSEGLIETFNRGGEEILGYQREDVIGRNIEDLYVEPAERRAAAAILEKTGHVKNYETRLLAKDDSVRNVLLTLSWLRDGKGQPIGTIGISKDVTQETQLQRELIQSQKFAAIGQAVTGIQHAIKNMLMSLQGGSYLIRNGMSKDKPQQVEEGRLMLEDGIKRIHGLSHNMLNLAREWRPDLQEVDLYDLVAGLCEANRPTASDKGIALRHEGKNGLPTARCDPKLIHMAATDILVNAIDACLWKDYHSDEAPEVVLRNSLTDDGNCCVIEVRDNGCGMSEDIKRNLFTPFFSTKETLGTGLGLAVTAKIIRAHEGEIAVESVPDRGSTFRICIPRNGPKDKRGG